MNLYVTCTAVHVILIAVDSFYSQNNIFITGVELNATCGSKLIEGVH